MGKTIVPIKSNGYKIVKGSTTSSSVTFNSKIIAIYYTCKFQNGYYAHGYGVEPSSNFYNDNALFDNTYPVSKPLSYYRYGSSTYEFYVTITGNKVTFNGNVANINEWYYIAILEDNLEDDTRSIFLLNGTILLTDGTPTTDVADAIQTIDTNKYKIKSNALVNISNATYIDLSN